MSLNLHNTLMALSSALLMLVMALMLAAPASDAAGIPKQGGDAAVGAPAADQAPRHAARGVRRPDIRSAIALPYFSFAQGLRRGKGG